MRPDARCGSTSRSNAARQGLALECPRAQRRALHGRALGHHLTRREVDMRAADVRPDDHDAAVLGEGVEVAGEVRRPTSSSSTSAPRPPVASRTSSTKPSSRSASAPSDSTWPWPLSLRTTPRHARAADDADLTGRAADAARGAVDEQRLARDEAALAADRVVGRHEPLGDAATPARRASREPARGGARARARGREPAAADQAEHAVAGREPEDSRAGTRRPFRRPRGPGTSGGQPGGGGIAALALLHVGGIQPRVADAISTSPLPGSGSGRSSMRMTSLPPAPV